MAVATPHLRHVKRVWNFGDGDVDFVGLQQWFAYEGWENRDEAGYWEDVPLSLSDAPFDSAP